MDGARLDDRFLTAWKLLEQHLAEVWSEHERRAAPDAAALLRWAERRRLLSADTEDFLQGCRMARNAYAHVAFDGYRGPVTLPRPRWSGGSSAWPPPCGARRPPERSPSVR